VGARFAIASIALCTLLVGGCGPAIHTELAGVDVTGYGPMYAGDEVGCGTLGGCRDLLAEVDAFVDEYEPGRGPVSVTFHTLATAEGPAVVMRSGGSTWMAIVTLNDGSRSALVIGCGIGIAVDMCFSTDAAGRHHLSGS
jgi:hypothetical protein